VRAAAPVDGALALRAARLESDNERRAVARVLRQAVRQAHEGRSLPFTARVSVHRSNIIAAESLIDDITLRLASQRPVHARGMARLRRLLADGRGPFYERGRGDLGGRLRAAFAAL